jgi:sec-independent protein translocase protein TatB
MLNLGLVEIMFIVALALVVIGPERLPEVLRFVGRQYGKLMRTSNELRRAFMLEAERGDVEKRAAAMRERREEARQRIAEQRARAEKNDNETPDVEAVGITGNPFGTAPHPDIVSVPTPDEPSESVTPEAER